MSPKTRIKYSNGTTYKYLCTTYIPVDTCQFKVTQQKGLAEKQVLLPVKTLY